MTAHTRWARLLDRFTPSESSTLSVLSMIVGGGTGLSVLFFKQVIDWVHLGAFEVLGVRAGVLGPWPVVLIPAVGGLVVGLLVTRFVGHERHHGVAGIIEAVALAGGRLRYRRIPLKALASAISIGVGASVGPEDPSVQIGSGLGSMLGQRLRLSDERVRVLVAAGAAGGIATAFNAPLAGVFFALEIVLGEFSIASFGVVVLAAVVASAISQALVGPFPAFPIPLYALSSPLELPLYFGLGLIAAFVAVFYIFSIYYFQDKMARLPLPGWLKPAIIGLGLGLVAHWYPQILGEGYGTVAEILRGSDPAVLLLLLLVVLKILATALSLGGGFVGGVFAPSLFLGAALGGAYGQVMARLLPGLAIEPSAYALVGMGAVLAGAVRAPITAILLLFELTNDYRILLPMMFAVAVSIFVSENLQHESVYTLSLVRKGIRLRRGRDVDVLEALAVEEVMEREPPVAHEDESLKAVSERMVEAHAHGLPVLDRAGNLVGVIAVQDIERALEKGLGLDHTVGEVCTRAVLVTYPDETVNMALRKMNARDIGRLPVVSREDHRRLVGWLRRGDILKAYDVALVRRNIERHRAEQVRLGAVIDSDVLELKVAPHAPVAGRTMAEIQWPRDSLVASVLRRGRLIIPHGDTRLEPGDVLVAVAEPSAVGVLRAMVEGEAEGE